MLDVPLANMLGLWPSGAPPPRTPHQHAFGNAGLPQPAPNTHFLATVMCDGATGMPPTPGPGGTAPPSLPRLQPQPWHIGAAGGNDQTAGSSEPSQECSTCETAPRSPFLRLIEASDAQKGLSTRSSERQRQHRPSWLSGTRAAKHLAGPWDEWELPTALTTAAGVRIGVSSPARLFDHLLALFYAQPSFSSLVVAQPERLMARLRRDAPDPAPGFLLHTMAACAAGLPNSEPELRACAARLLREAHEEVCAEQRAGVQSLELIQALLLLAANWPGEPDAASRRSCLHAALRMGDALGLQRTSQLYESPGPPATRFVLLWCLYVADKLDCVAAGGETARLKAASVDWCMPTPERVAELLPTEAGAHAGRLAQLAAGCIALARVLEDVLEALYAPVNAAPLPLQVLEERTRIMERHLEQVCFSQRHLLHVPPWTCAMDVAGIDCLSRLVHLIQLVVHRAVLLARVCATMAAAHAQRRQPPSPLNCVVFATPTEQRALGVSLESAWHLLHPPGYALQALHASAVDGFARAAVASDARLDVARFGAVMGARLLRFVACYWQDWADGHGAVVTVPHLVSPLQQTRHAARQLHRARAHTDPGAEATLRWRAGASGMPSPGGSGELAMSPERQWPSPVQAFRSATSAAGRHEPLAPALRVFGVDVQAYLNGVSQTQRHVSLSPSQQHAQPQAQSQTHPVRPSYMPLPPPPSYEFAMQLSE